MAAPMLMKGAGTFPRACLIVTSTSSANRVNRTQRSFHMSSCLEVDRRKDKAIMQHLHYIDHEKSLHHRNTPIVTLPDYSYLDDRPTELGICQKQRQERNYELSKKVVQFVEEMKFAQQHLVALETSELQRQQKRRESRLKPKVEEPAS